MIAACAVDAALNRIRENAASERGRVNSRCDAGVGGKRGFGFSVADEFDAEEKAQAANVSDDGAFF